MSTDVLTQLQVPRRLKDSVPSPRPQWQISMAVSVNADRGRLHSAFTLPEYMEAWISFPGTPSTHRASVIEMPDGFQIVGVGPEEASVRIEGRYRVSRRSKLLFTWKREGNEYTHASLVLIRLVGDFARTNVHLHHVGFASRSECSWHRQLWERSLEKLRSLF